MPNAANIAARMVARIRSSVHQLTIHYPAAVTKPSGTSPSASGPLSPLTGVKPVETLAPAVTTPIKPPVTLGCLWYDATALGDLKRNSTTAEALGWVVGAEVMAVVTVADGAVNPNLPAKDTLFDNCDYVVHDEQRHEVLRVTPVGASFAKPYCYYVWLKGAKRQ